MKNALAMLTTCLLATAMGCHAIDFYTPSLQSPVPPELEPPRELSMVSLPAYRIAPPDVLRIEVVKLVPRPSYRITPFDALQINVLGTLRAQPIRNNYLVESEGVVTLGPPYGTVRVAGLTIEEAEADITRSLRFILKEPVVSVQLSRSASVEQLTGFYPVEPDGVVNLRAYGPISVTGKTVTEARMAVQERLAQYFDSPQAGVEVAQYNSESYYVITESVGGAGNMLRFPITGNETVLDALGQPQQIMKMSSKTIWVARPTPGEIGREQIFPVDWEAIAHGGRTDTNYQIMPGDRIYIVDDSLVAADAFIAKFTRPIGRLLGISSLGASTARNLQGLGRDFNSINRRHRGSL